MTNQRSSAPLQPTRLTPQVADDAPPPRRLSAPRGALLWLSLSVGACLAALYAVPRLLAPPPAPPTAAGATPATPEEPPDPILTPAEKAAARLEAQQALAGVLARSDGLAARSPADWDAAAWRAAQTRIADGERAYRQERYPSALRIYADAARQLAALEAQVPGLVNDRLQAGLRALDAGDSVHATQFFQQLLKIDSTHAAGRTALARAEAYERVQALLTEGLAYERMDDVPKARAAFEAALALDGATVAASEGLARLTETDSAEAYAKAMSSGYEAMAAARFDEARSAFERARKLNPTSAAQAALAQSIERGVAARIAAALATAERSEKAERWDEAARAYASALALDKGLTDLKPKADYARSRAALASEIADAVAAPGPASRASLQALLARVARIESAGPRLRAQRKQLEQALRALEPAARE